MYNIHSPASIYGWLSLPKINADSGIDLAGAVFLLSPILAMTCAHVVRDHLGLSATPIVAPSLPLVLRFEAFDAQVIAKVDPNGWYPDGSGGPPDQLRDIAFLSLSQPIEANGLRYPSLAPWLPRGGRPALVIGAEPGYQIMSQTVPVRLAEHANNKGLWQLNAAPDSVFNIVRGFSGAPLMDECGTVIWGMVTEVDARGRPVAFAVGADRLYEAHVRLSQAVDLAALYAPEPLNNCTTSEMIRVLEEAVLRVTMERDAALRELDAILGRGGTA